MKLSLDHIAIPINDAQATHRFYTDVMGFTLLDAKDGPYWEGKPWLMSVYAAGYGRQLVFIAFKGAKRPAMSCLPRDSQHIAF